MNVSFGRVPFNWISTCLNIFIREIDKRPNSMKKNWAPFRNFVMVDVNINSSCTYQYRYSKGFDSCLYLHGEPLRLTLLICTTSIFAFLIILFLMLITAKKLLTNLIKEQHGTTHTFLSKSDFIESHNIKSSSHSSQESQPSRSISVSQSRSEQSDTNR